MSNENTIKDSDPVFDPIKLEQMDVSKDYPMEKEDFEKLYNNNCYCEMAHCNKNGFPIVTPMFYVIINDEIYVSSISKFRAKPQHFETDPRVSVMIHNDGAQLRHQKAILVTGRVELITEQELMKKIHWAMIDKYFTDLKTEEIRNLAFKAIHTPHRVVIRVKTNKRISWDFGKMVQSYCPGAWFGDAYNMVKDL
ncbi:MAG: pyridoxamine 5'-phosphate oxidase family protein [Georgfuchsia sp.]